jgi:DNA-binding NarL/FixJ family response regulator
MKLTNAMLRTVLIYGLVLGVSAFALQWLQYQYLVKLFPVEAYIITIAFAFTILGVWAGKRFTPTSSAPSFIKNEAALRSLGITPREYVVLECLATGLSNKQIAGDLGLSPNTIKTHIANLLAKLEVARRTEAIHKARTLSLIP